MTVIVLLLLLLLHMFTGTKTQSNKTGVLSEDSPQRKEAYKSCNKGWFAFADKCYGIGGKRGVGKLNWENAVERCKEFGGQLATIHSQELSDFLRAFILMDVQANLWIGLHDRVNESDYQWVDGTEVDYTSWEPTEPSGIKDEKEDCVEMVFRTGKADAGGQPGNWNDIDCGNHLDFICQKKKSKQGRKAADPKFCPDRIGGWRLRSSCYHIVSKKLSWIAAEEYCLQEHQGHLASIKDFTVHLFLQYILRNYTDDFWIGIKIKDEYQQQWSSGWFVSYSNWMEEQADFIEGACAARISTEEWITQPCNSPLPFICETSSLIPPSLKSNEESSHCPDEPEGWRDLGGQFCYYIETHHFFTWTKANFMCMRRGGTLVSINSQEEVDVLQQFLIFTQYVYWIGLYRHMQHDEEFVWADGTILNFTFWNSGEPNSEKEMCVELKTDTMKWNDIDCDQTRNYICSTRKISPNRTKLMSVTMTPACSSGITIISLVGVLLCVVLVAVLVWVVVYYFRSGEKEHGDSGKTTELLLTATGDQIPKYKHIDELVVKEDNYENVP